MDFSCALDGSREPVKRDSSRQEGRDLSSRMCHPFPKVSPKSQQPLLQHAMTITTC